MEQFVEGNKKKIRPWWAYKKKVIKTTRWRNTYTRLLIDKERRGSYRLESTSKTKKNKNVIETIMEWMIQILWGLAMEDVLNMNSSSQIASGCRKVTQNYQRF